MKKILAVIGFIVLLVPTALSVLFYNKIIIEESLRERLLCVEVRDEHGELYEYASDSEENKSVFAVLREFSDVNEKSMSNKDDLVRLFENSSLAAENPKCSRFYIKYKTNHAEYTVELFIVDKERNGNFIAYLALDDGSVYCFNDTARQRLLTCKFTYTVYNNSRIPELAVGDELLSYSAAVWKVKTANGEFVEVPCNNGKIAEFESFETQFEFSVKPDAVSARVRDENDAELYNADLSAIGGFKLDRSGRVTVDVTAFWYQQSDRGFYGTVTYTYTAYYAAEARFELSGYEVKPGGSLLLSCLNIPENARISAMLGSRSVKLYRNGENVYAFLPFSYDTAPGLYRVEIDVSGKKHTLDVTVSEKAFGNTASIPSSMMSADRLLLATSEEARKEYTELFAQITATESSGNLSYDGILLDYQKSFSLYKGYGLYMPYEASGASLRNDGVIFTVRAGSDVPSMGAGTVAAVGECAYLGKYVVVDHGYGLRTWYTALGDISVNVGDSVDKGTVIAKSGIGGISPDGTMLVMITLDEIPVSPYAFWEESRSFAR